MTPNEELLEASKRLLRTLEPKFMRPGWTSFEESAIQGLKEAIARAERP